MLIYCVTIVFLLDYRANNIIKEKFTNRHSLKKLAKSNFKDF